MKTTKTIEIDGRTREVLDSLSSGPGAPAHTYELRGRAYVYQIACDWWLQEPGREARRVSVVVNP